MHNANFSLASSVIKIREEQEITQNDIHRDRLSEPSTAEICQVEISWNYPLIAFTTPFSGLRAVVVILFSV